MLSQDAETRLLPADWRDARLIGRLALADGPTPVLLEGGSVYDLTPVAATVSELFSDPSRIRAHDAKLLGPVEEVLGRHETLLAPVDLQVVKASGVTFALSAIERVIEERARGDSGQAAAIRGKIESRVGANLRAVKPGSEEARALKAALIEDGLWSQYLEVAIGPDAEIFTKSPVLSAVGWGAEVGIRSDSNWNNPEPEVVIVATSRGEPVGAALGNDVNLRDIEGRSALLLGKAKDNNASCSIGPFVRLFDDSFTMDDVRQATVRLEIDGEDGYRLEGDSKMAQISRDPLDLLAQAMSEHHYPDGYCLFLGTLFAPTQDRDEPGRGFTHKLGDRVRISTPKLGTLENRVTHSKSAPPWTDGIGALMRNLAQRGLLARS